MENFFNYFKQKLSLDDEQLYKLRNIILSDNKTFVKEILIILLKINNILLTIINFFIAVYSYIVLIYIVNLKKNYYLLYL